MTADDLREKVAKVMVTEYTQDDRREPNNRDRQVVDVVLAVIREAACGLHESIDPASDMERLRGDPGAGAMGAVIQYRDKLRALLGGGHE